MNYRILSHLDRHLSPIFAQNREAVLVEGGEKREPVCSTKEAYHAPIDVYCDLLRPLATS